MTTWELCPSQVLALYEASAQTREHARDLAILCLCVDAGLRRGEVTELHVGDVDLQAGVVSVGAGPRRRRVRLGATALGAIAAFVCDRRATEPLLISRAGAPVTDRSVHEQLRRIGEIAGLGEWVSCRHTRRTYISAIARCHVAPVALRLAGHAGFRIRPASIEDALQAELGLAWRSPLDEMLTPNRCRPAA